MDWRGIELAVPVYEILMLVVPVYAFITFYRRVKCGVLGKSGALWRYVLFVSTPIILIVLLFFTLVGFEELTDIVLITEGLARTILILVGSWTFHMACFDTYFWYNACVHKVSFIYS